MSGRVITKGQAPHSCEPGWEWKQSDHEIAPGSGAHRYGVPPDPWRYPEGTVWECECGRRWVSRGSVYVNSPGMCFWRRERLAARLWRLVQRLRP